MSPHGENRLLPGEHGDAQFLDRIATEYRGRHDATDAVDWLLDADSLSRNGRRSPAAGLRELQDRVYSDREGGSSHGEAVAELQVLEMTLAEDRRALGVAIEAARNTGQEDADAKVPDDEVARHIIEPVPGRFFRSAIVTCAIAVAALGTGVVVGVRSSPATPPIAPPAPAAQEVSRAVALEMFDRPQETTDIPPVDLGAEFLPESLRSFGRGFDGEPLAFAGLRSDNRICLIVDLGEREAAASCVVERVFASGGATLYWTTHLDGVPATSYVTW